MQIQPLGRHVRTEEQAQRILPTPETFDDVLLLGIGELTVHEGDLLVTQAQVALALTVQPAQGLEALGEHHDTVRRIAQGPPALGRLEVGQQPLLLGSLLAALGEVSVRLCPSGAYLDQCSLPRVARKVSTICI